MKIFLVVYFSMGLGSTIALTAAGWDIVKKYDWLQIIYGHTLATVFWPVAIWNNRNNIRKGKHILSL